MNTTPTMAALWIDRVFVYMSSQPPGTTVDLSIVGYKVPRLGVCKSERLSQLLMRDSRFIVQRGDICTVCLDSNVVQGMPMPYIPPMPEPERKKMRTVARSAKAAAPFTPLRSANAPPDVVWEVFFAGDSSAIRVLRSWRWLWVLSLTCKSFDALIRRQRDVIVWNMAPYVTLCKKDALAMFGLSTKKDLAGVPFSVTYHGYGMTRYERHHMRGDNVLRRVTAKYDAKEGVTMSRISGVIARRALRMHKKEQKRTTLSRSPLL